ncbi:MAG: thioredoxin [Deltaproteobacteria bacterium]|nr:MAG: thioredoxin [Deltaproteobacteria bacterium]
MAGANLMEFTEENWQREVLESDRPVLVDFWAPWCGPCRAIAPHVEALAEAYAGKVKVGKLNIDDHQAPPRDYGVRGIPTLLLFKNGEVVDQIVGAVGKDKIESMIQKVL